jgi:hypothetical protein
MWSKLLFSLSLLFLLISCKENSKENLVIPKDSSSTPIDSAETTGFRKKTIDFFSWYSKNRNQLYKIEFLKGGYSSETDSIPFYIDKKKMDEYINEFKKSKFLSSSYIKALENHLNDVAFSLESEKIYDGVIDGMDYDYITQSQDDEEMLENIKNIKEVEFKIKSKENVYIKYEIVPKILFLKINYTFEDDWVIHSYEFEYNSN